MTRRVYQIQFDVKNYQVLLVDGDDDFSFPFFRLMRSKEAAPIGAAWTPPPLYVDRPRLKQPDIFHLVGAIGPVFNARAVSLLEKFIGRAGELLPLPFLDEILGLLNVTEIVDCLDEKKTVFDGGGAARVLEFHAHRISETPLFRIPQNQSSQLFCHRGVAEDGWDFRAAVEQADLTGLVFDEVWNDKVGGIEHIVRW